MGILNVTPDSFSDGGAYLDAGSAAERIAELVAEGADIVDLGAESTRPGAAAIEAREQIARLGRLVATAAAAAPCVSVDTTSGEVARFALGDGARMVNSVSLAPAAELAKLCAEHGAALVLTHCRGSMSEMGGFSSYPDASYGDVVDDVKREWLLAAQPALDAGLPPGALYFDPGLGFTKNAKQSLELCARLDELVPLGYPILVGPSRKSYLGRVVADELGGPPPPANARLGASVAACLACAGRGADIVRVHDVAVVRQALAYARALSRTARGAAGHVDA